MTQNLVKCGCKSYVHVGRERERETSRHDWVLLPSSASTKKLPLNACPLMHKSLQVKLACHIRFLRPLVRLRSLTPSLQLFSNAERCRLSSNFLVICYSTLVSWMDTKYYVVDQVVQPGVRLWEVPMEKSAIVKIKR